MRKQQFYVILALIGVLSFSPQSQAADNLPEYGEVELPTSTPETGKEYYVYNLNAQKFLTRTTLGGDVNGNCAWGTRACIGDFKVDEFAVDGANKIGKFDAYVFKLTQDTNTGLFSLFSTGWKRNRDYERSSVAQGYLNVSAAGTYGAGYVYTDHGGESYLYWKITPSGEMPSAYTMQYKTNENYLAPANDAEGSFTLQNENNNYKYWQFVLKENLPKYYARIALKQMLDNVKSELTDKSDAALEEAFTTAVGIYNDENAGSLQIYAQTTALQTAMDKHTYPGYEDITASCNIGTGFEDVFNRNTTHSATSTLAAGKYRLRIQAFDAFTSQGSYLYAKIKGVEQKTTIGIRTTKYLNINNVPTNTSTSEEAYAEGGYAESLVFEVPLEAEVEVGINIIASGSRWSTYKNMQLARIGDASDAATQEQIKTLTDLKESASVLTKEKMNGSILSKLQETLSAAISLLNETTPQAADVVTASGNLTSSISDAKTSIANYAILKQAYDNLFATWNLLKINTPDETGTITSAEAALKAINDSYEAATVEGIDNEIRAQIAAYHNAENTLRAKAMRKTVDTESIMNGTFDANSNWSGMGTWTQNCVEYYNTANINLYQTISGLSANETYSLSVQGFHRANDQKVIDAYLNGTGAMNAYLYAKSSNNKEWKLPLMSLYAESGKTSGNDNSRPISPAEAQENFSKGIYNNVLCGITPGTDGTLTIGIKYEGNLVSRSWTCVDNFSLTRDCHFDPLTGHATGDILKGDLIACEAAISQIKDEHSFRASDDVADKAISYVRNFSATGINQLSENGWQTICLPFDVETITADKNGTPKVLNPETDFWLYKADLTTQKFVKASSIEANRIYLLAMPNDPEIYAEEMNISGDVTFSGHGIKKTEIIPVDLASNYRFTADYQASNNGYGITDITENGQSRSVFKTATNNGAFWGYALQTGTGTAPTYLDLFGDHTTTSLREHNTLADPSQNIQIYTQGERIEVNAPNPASLGIYRTDGQFVKRIRVPQGISQFPMPAGKYIINGKIIIVNP